MGSNPVNLSASRGAAILGLSKYKSPLQAWLEIMESMKPGFCLSNGFLTPERKDPWAEPYDPKLASLRWGLAFEDAICELVGNVTDREKKFVYSKDDFITCHIDGLKNGRLQENKTAFAKAYEMSWGEPETDRIPKEYTVQVNHQSLCSGIKEIDVNVLVFPKAPANWEKEGYRLFKSGAMGNEKTGDITNPLQWAKNLKSLGYFHQYHITANEFLQKEMLERYREFWHINVEKEIPPPVNGYDDIKWLIASPEGELKASQQIKDLWSEYVDIDLEIESMVERKKEIKNNFAFFVDQELKSKKVKPGSEPRKLNVFAGARKLFSISRPFPGYKVSAPMVSTVKEDNPELYEEMKKTTFLDLMGDSLSLTEKQAEKVKAADKELSELEKTRGKVMKSLKLTKLLEKDSMAKVIKKNKPELFTAMFEKGLIVETEPNSRLNISKPQKD